MENDPRYIPVAQTLPAVLPPLDRKTGTGYARKLVRHFGRLGLGSPNQVRPADLRYYQWTAGRRVWVSPKPTTGHHKGWGRLIHDVSHLVFAVRHPTLQAHAGGHSTLEREIAEYVVEKGWLLPKPVVPKPERKVQGYERAQVRLKKWLAREKRCHTAIKKLKRAIARYERGLQP